ncbi:Beta-galactosidase trimerization domain protein [Polystyrenella longa]|uniref:Beta-galactosidase trimerization domain protein n=1 Tax=Polystyrenella longa TaxID=2528007 RepID=A0A518CKR5_9PLAN|nr:hypothetical protein [Polystyrenella longa]QDU79820.1 Beta-galactosidase trimerization domain protein [Polystyrenella longa]
MNRLVAIIVLLLPGIALAAEPIFVEAESFTTSTDGWKVQENRQTRSASMLNTLHGAVGDPSGVAQTSVTISEAGDFRIWVRFLHHKTRRGPFQLAVAQNNQTVGSNHFDKEPLPNAFNWDYVWDYFDLTLPAGTVELELSKTDQENCSPYVRHVDCVLLTTDKELTPNHLLYGPQTFLRVTLDDVYDNPVYIHIFADHYHAPWYQHFNLSKAGTKPGLRPALDERLVGGEQTPWCNITPMLYQDSGAILNITARHHYAEHAPQLAAKLEFASAPNEDSIVRTMQFDCQPNGLVVVTPPDLTTEEHRSRLMRDAEFAEATGKVADAMDWPTFGKKPESIPFFVSATVGGYDTEVDKAVSDREWKTLDYFGFSNRDKSYIGGLWYMHDRSFCRPDIEKMKESAATKVDKFVQSGKSIDDIAYCMLMDEPTGQPASFAAADEAYHEAFRNWIKKLGKTPEDLLVADWDAVRPVPESERDQSPALHYFTQRFRTRALGDFMAIQRGILEEAYGRTLPTLVNFSDGATYHANFYGQGVDYFELLDSDDQNALWSEDWANGASSYQCGAYNVDLMRAAARERGQTLGHYLVAHAGRKPWDIKLKGASETARGIRLWKNFSYGVSWGSHEGGPTWKSHTWYSKPEKWIANAEVVREIGGAEDLLLSSTAKPAEVAVLYSSSTDAWTLGQNYAFGFNRMHTWMALAHAQIPVDFVSEQQVEKGLLQDYKVCYLSGPNLTSAAAEKLRDWIMEGGVLYLSAGAASHDEFNRPLATLDELLPADREPLQVLQPFLNSGSYLHILQAQDVVTAGEQELDVLSVQQRQSARSGSEVLATFKDGSAAIVRTDAGQGSIYSAGFLPSLDYIKQALVARRDLQAAQVTAEELATNRTDVPTPVLDLKEGEATTTGDSRLERSDNPWEYSADVRELILQPVRTASITPPLTCNVPLVDAVLLEGDSGAVIPLANYTLAPLKQVDFTLQPAQPITRIESIHQGELNYHTTPEGKVHFSLPLDSSDYVQVFYR